MRILIVNPNTTEEVTSLMLDAGARGGVAGGRGPRDHCPEGSALHHEPGGGADRRSDRARNVGGGARRIRRRDPRGLRRSGPVRRPRAVRLSRDRHIGGRHADRMHARRTISHRHLRRRAMQVGFATASPCTDWKTAAPASLRWTAASARWRTFARRIGRR